MTNLPQITQIQFPENQDYRAGFPKKQIYLHHTAGNSGAKNVFTGWEVDTARIGTCIAISGEGKNSIDGEIVQDTSKPNGTPRKLQDVNRLHAQWWKHTIELQEGIKIAYEWFLHNC